MQLRVLCWAWERNKAEVYISEVTADLSSFHLGWHGPLPGAFSKLQACFSIFQVFRRTAGSCAWCQELLPASWEQQRCHDSHLRGQPTKGKGDHSSRELPCALRDPKWRRKWRVIRIQGWMCWGFVWILPWILLSIAISVEAVSARSCKEVSC